MILARTREGRNPTLANPVGKSRWRKSLLFDDSPAAGQTVPPISRFDAATFAAAVALRPAAWITVWVAAFAVIGWLFIAGFAGFNH
jgi:hypothetical protein